MLCPFCLRPVEQFTRSTDDRGLPLLGCPLPDCNEQNVPLLYPDGYAEHPPLPLSLIGLTNHGKTVYISALMQELDRLGTVWPGFHYQWLDEAELRAARRRLADLAEGRLPPATRSVFPRPQIVRLGHVPRVGGCQLLIYDTGGETFLDVSGIIDAGRYLRRSPAIVWLVSLTDLESPNELSDALMVYVQSLAVMQGDAQAQSVVIALTKGDLLLDKPGLPQSARDYLLHDDLDPAGDSWERLTAVSNDLEKWLTESGHHNTVNLLKSRFQAVRYCLLSAQGAEAREQELQLKLMPRGVLAPLFWLWSRQRPAVWLEEGEKRTMFFSVEEAAARAEPGATLRLDPGHFVLTRKLMLTKPLKLVGQGADATFLGSGADLFTLGVRVEGAIEIADMTVEHNGRAAADVLRVLGGTVQARNCRFRGGRQAEGGRANGDGVVLAGESRGHFVQCRFERNAGNGLTVRDQAAGEVLGGRASHNGQNGLHCLSAAGGTFINNVCEENHNGVRFSASGRGTVEANVCRKNDRHGISVTDQASAELRKNRCEQNGRAGVGYSGSGTGTAVGNDCRGNGKSGIGIEETARPELLENQCIDNKDCGISYGGRTGGTARANECRSNHASGVRVADDANPELAANACQQNKEHGIHYAGRAAGKAERNQCRSNQKDGLRVEEAAGPEVNLNQCDANGQTGLAITESAQPKVGKNDCANNGLKDTHDARKLFKRWFGEGGRS